MKKKFEIFTLFFMIALTLFMVGAPQRKTASDAAKKTVPNTLYQHAKTAIDANTCSHYVVCGGVHDTAAYLKAIQNPAVKELYRPTGSLHITKTTHVFFAYDSYRIGNKIYWTRKPRLIPTGTEVWADGIYSILVRCGNLISNDPQIPTLDAQEPTDLYPPMREYDDPVAPEISDNNSPWIPESPSIYAPPTSEPPALDAPQPLNLSYIPLLLFTAPQPVDSPEPGMFWFMLAGLLIGSICGLIWGLAERV